MKAKLSDSVCGKFAAEAKEYIVYDEQVPFLGLRIQPSGAKSFTFIKRIGEKVLKKALGKFPDMSVDAARQAAVVELTVVKQVKEEKQNQRYILTCDQIFQSYLTDHVEPFTSDSNLKNARGGWAKHKGSFGDISICDLTKADVQRWVSGIGKNVGHATANRRFNDFRAAFNWALDKDMIQVVKNPTDGIETFEDNERTRYLTTEEWDRLKGVLERTPGDISEAILLMFATGARRGNVLAMHWGELDWHNKTWTIPKKKAKTRKVTVLALSDLALEILERRLFKTKGVGYVFPSSESKTGYLYSIDKEWKKIREEAGLYDENDDLRVHLHDLRHTVGTWLSQSGANAFTIQSIMGHSNISTTRRYVERNKDDARVHLNNIQKADKVHVQKREAKRA